MTPFLTPADSQVEERFLERVGARWIHQLEHGAPVRFQVLEPELVAAFDGARLHADSPEVARIEVRARRRQAMTARLDAALAVEVSHRTAASLVAEVVAIDPAVLDRTARLRYVLLCDRVSTWSQAHASAALAAYAGSESPAGSDPAAAARRDRHLRLEVRMARGISDDAAARDIEAARRLDAELRPVREAWSNGSISSRHVAVLLDRTRSCDPQLTTSLLDRLGDRVASIPAHRIGTVVNAALAALDPRGQAARARHARTHEVGVTQRTLADGLGQITVIDKVEITRAIIERIDDGADHVLLHSLRCGRCADDVPAEIGPARAAAFRSLVLDGHDECRTPSSERGEDGAPVATTDETSLHTAAASGRGSRRSRRGELQVVIDLATLVGLADNPALLAGQPVPADLARELAEGCGTLRRIVTDPVDGHLLDYGTRTYLPDALRNHIAARDGTCRAPGCGQPASRCQLDHVVPFPQGPSAVGNTTMLCRRDHTIKTDGDLVPLEHLPDGATRWRTRDGQLGVIAPRPYLPDLLSGSAPRGAAPDDCPF